MRKPCNTETYGPAASIANHVGARYAQRGHLTAVEEFHQPTSCERLRH
jgi:hypothetical protein